MMKLPQSCSSAIQVYIGSDVMTFINAFSSWNSGFNRSYFIVTVFTWHFDVDGT